MAKVNKKLIILLALIVLIIGIIPSQVKAFDTNFYEPNGTLDTGEEVTTMAGKIIGAIQYFGIIAAVLVLAILGIKFMLGSVEEKAEYKKAFMPYIAGCAMLILVPTLVRFAANVMNNDDSTLPSDDEPDHQPNPMAITAQLNDGYYYCNTCGAKLDMKDWTIEQIYNFISKDTAPCTHIIQNSTDVIEKNYDRIVSKIKNDNTRGYLSIWKSCNGKNIGKQLYNDENITNKAEIFYNILIAAEKINHEYFKPTVTAVLTGSTIEMNGKSEKVCVCGFCGEQLKMEEIFISTWDDSIKEGICSECYCNNINPKYTANYPIFCQMCNRRMNFNDNNSWTWYQLYNYLVNGMCPCGSIGPNYSTILNEVKNMDNIVIIPPIAFTMNGGLWNCGNSPDTLAEKYGRGEASDKEKLIIELCAKYGYITKDSQSCYVKTQNNICGFCGVKYEQEQGTIWTCSNCHCRNVNN